MNLCAFQHKETVFHYCASEGNVDVLQQILENLHQGQIQLAVNKQSVTGWSPLIVASSKGHLEIVKVSNHNAHNRSWNPNHFSFFSDIP